MQIADALSLLALRPLASELCPANHDVAAAVSLGERLRTAAPQLTPALRRAHALAWRTLEVLLAGPSFWDGCQIFLDAADVARLRQQVRALAAGTALARTGEAGQALRRTAGRELRALRQAGLLEPGNGAAWSAGQWALLATPGDPRRLLDGEREVLARAAEALRRGGAPTLALLCETRGAEPPLLVVLVRCLVRREWRGSEELAALWPLDERNPTSAARQSALTEVVGVLAEHGRGLQEWLVEDQTPAPAAAAARTAAQQAQQGDTAKPGAAPATATASSAPVAAGPTPAPAPAAAGAPVTLRQRLRAGLPALKKWAPPGLLVGAVLTLPVGLLWFVIHFYSAREMQRFEGHEKPVLAAALDPQGKFVVTGGLDKTLRVWDADSGEELRQLKGHEHQVQQLLVAPDGKHILSVSKDRVLLWDAATGKQVNGIVVTKPEVSPHLFLVKDVPLALLLNHKTQDCTVWDIGRAKMIHTFPGPQMAVGSVAVAPDGKVAAFGGHKVIRLWDIGTGKEVGQLSGHAGDVVSLAFSADGTRLASGGVDSTVRLWDVADRKQLASLMGHTCPVVSVALSPDGKRLLSGSTAAWPDPKDKTKEVADRRPLRLWNVANPEQAREDHMFDVPHQAVRSVAFGPDPDDRLALTAGDDQLARLWRLPP